MKRYYSECIRMHISDDTEEVQALVSLLWYPPGYAQLIAFLFAVKSPDQMQLYSMNSEHCHEHTVTVKQKPSR